MESSEQHNHQIIESLPCWTSSISIARLDGGITNHNYRVSDSDQQFVVRLGADIPVHQIMRFNEIAAAKAAHASGLSPQIRHHEDGALVMDYIPSTALTEEKMQQKKTLERVMEIVKRCHQDIPDNLRGATLVFWVFHVIRNYASTLKEGNSRHTPSLQKLLQDSDQLQAASGPHDIVFGHNDLLAANLLDDGNRLWLIDWEYAGFNSPLFDLGLSLIHI